MKSDNVVHAVYIPFDRSQYILAEHLTDKERAAVSVARRRTVFQEMTTPVPPLMQPLRDIALQSGIPARIAKATIQAVLAETYNTNSPCWKWPEDIWMRLFKQSCLSGPLLAAFAWHLGSVRKPLELERCRQPACYASAIFGRDFFHRELKRLTDVLVSLGYSLRHQEMFLSAVLGTLMLENGDPRLESFTEDQLKRGQQYRTEGIARAVGKVSHGLAAMGILSRPLRMRGYTGWREKRTEGIASEWVQWCQRWRKTSVLRPRTRETNYSFILRIGLWLARDYPDIREPGDWTISTCASFIAALGRMNVDDLSLEPEEKRRVSARSGQPMMSNSRASFLYALRRFFVDYELWGWGKLHLSPYRHLSTPDTPAFSRSVNPRVIDDPVWLKLIWASLNLRPEDMLTEIHYPFAMHQAMAVIWTHAGLRQNEILRLTVGGVREQTDDIVQEDGSIISAGTLCWLDVPSGKTSKAFVKPVASVVKTYVDLWLQVRPPEQAPLTDERTAERVNYLFQYRGKQAGSAILNNTIIPVLCARAGVPRDDSRGRITSHRGRASAVTALASVPQGMTLHELMEWSGHSCPRSTLHYIRIRPTRLAASFVKADKISHMISVLIDHDCQSITESGPALYYDLGELYCTNPFWSSCPHRMACIGCDFSLPKSSSRAQTLESKASIHRYLEEVPLTPDEKAIAEGDIDKLTAFIKKMSDQQLPGKG
ncbi:integrase [Salmonella enterica subsp. enterica]|uniref:tyrosine-type recombinase/integrase n=1 Tax=Salmonella enterica TaxID=28901 RepID=UPI000BE47186|nr:tyrosine-type recombinase/integrase [Salmonella enterica]ATI83626.1 integrase [Salmonella enterica subsp. enterica]ATI85839.1 integrase [Salmonella enterica subsp. enterica]EJQ0716790.1 tyrosine-type recombinase/integrase [Salmonella enterica]